MSNIVIVLVIIHFIPLLGFVLYMANSMLLSIWSVECYQFKYYSINILGTVLFGTLICMSDRKKYRTLNRCFFVFFFYPLMADMSDIEVKIMSSRFNLMPILGSVFCFFALMIVEFIRKKLNKSRQTLRNIDV